MSEDDVRDDGDIERLPNLVRSIINVPQQGTSLRLCPTNLKLSSMTQRAALLKMAGPASESLRKQKEVRIKAVYWAIIPDRKEDPETGEIKEVVYVCFMAEDGSTFRTTAKHGPARLMALLQLFEPEEWADGITIVITEKVGARGRTYHDIQVDVGDCYSA